MEHRGRGGIAAMKSPCVRLAHITCLNINDNEKADK